MSESPSPSENEKIQKGLEILAELDRRDLREESRPPNLLVTLTPLWAILLGWVFIPENAVAFVKVSFYSVCVALLVFFVVLHIRVYRNNLLLAASRSNPRKEGGVPKDLLNPKASKESSKELKRERVSVDKVKMPKEFKK